ncbi:MAG: hypothetical protein J3K34DRAFT_499386 [Monoraphidium minutum]|nr:MAG: hypothetical protein J3K34DRAFT_499386 [Monoraphidium minutum]
MAATSMLGDAIYSVIQETSPLRDDGIDAAAADARMTRAEFVRAVDNDPDFGFDANSRQGVYACAGLAVPDGAAASIPDLEPHTHAHAHAHGDGAGGGLLPAQLLGGAAAAGSASAGDADPSDLSLALRLHSRPGAPRFILLAFSGCNTTNTVWNDVRHPNGTITYQDVVTPPFDLDGNTAALSDAEKTAIIAIWRAVAEDFAFAEVDVTTEELDAAGNPLEVTDQGVRVCIGGSSMDWFGYTAGGVAYLHSFGRPVANPTFVFPKELSNKPRAIAEATSHEVGHALGLYHDGKYVMMDGVRYVMTYYEGHANWAPIMGNSYYRAVSQWSKGEYVDASETQDDIQQMLRQDARMVSKTGYLTRRADDYTTPPGQIREPLPSVMTAGDPRRSVVTWRGNLEASGDEDWVMVHSGGGTATITVTTTPSSSAFTRANAHIELGVCQAGGGVIGTPLASSGKILAGSFSFELPYNTYYVIRVLSVGDGPDGNTGYTNYGSLGEYKILIDHPTPPELIIKVVSGSSTRRRSGRFNWRRRADVTLSARNAATGAPIVGKRVTVRFTFQGRSGLMVPSSQTVSRSFTTRAGGAFTVESQWSWTAGRVELRLHSATAAGFKWDPSRSDVSSQHSI